MIALNHLLGVGHIEKRPFPHVLADCRDLQLSPSDLQGEWIWWYPGCVV